MFMRLLTPFLILGAGLASQFMHNAYTIAVLNEVAITLYVIAAFFFLRLVFTYTVTRYVSDSRRRYTFRKTVSVVLLALTLVIVLWVWVEDPQALFVAYGLVAAGVAVALQDVFKNLAGGIAILVTRLYRVGNRIEVDGVHGDVIDIGIFYTSLLEIGGWVDGDQSTGRITSVPNGAVLDGVVNNYTRDHHFLWDEIAIPVTYKSDTRLAMEILRHAAGEHTEDFSAQARRSITDMEQRYYLAERDMEPSVFVRATDNWMLLTVRYVVEVRERRRVMSDITKDVVSQIQHTDTIEIASETLDITDFSN